MIREYAVAFGIGCVMAFLAFAVIHSDRGRKR